MTDAISGRDPLGQALAVPATPANAVDGPSGFDPSRVTPLIAHGAKPLSVLGRVVTGGDIAIAIDRMANAGTMFRATDLIGPDFMRGAHFTHKQEALNRLCQRWRKLGLMEFKVGRWWLPRGAWDKLQAIAMEARRAETLGSVHDSADPKGIARKDEA